MRIQFILICILAFLFWYYCEFSNDWEKFQTFEIVEKVWKSRWQLTADQLVKNPTQDIYFLFFLIIRFFKFLLVKSWRAESENISISLTSAIDIFKGKWIDKAFTKNFSKQREIESNGIYVQENRNEIEHVFDLHNKISDFLKKLSVTRNVRILNTMISIHLEH